jgi:hypothetical protein
MNPCHDVPGESRPGTVPPTTPVRPSPPLFDAVRHGQRRSRGTVPPTPIWSTRRTLERGRRSPRREDGRLLHARTGLRRDVGPAGPVTSVAIGPVRLSPPSPTPSQALHHHPQHYGGRGDKTLPRRLLCAPRPPVSRTLEPMYGRRPNGRPLQRHPRSRSWTDTGHAMTPRQMQDSPGRSSTPQRFTPCLYT